MNGPNISGHDLREIAPAPEQVRAPAAPVPRSKFDLIRIHPYASAAALALLALLIGGLIVSSRSTAAPSSLRAWGGVNLSTLNPAYAGPRANPESARSIAPEARSVAPYSYIPITNGAPLYAPGGETAFDFDAFIKLLSEGNEAQTDVSASAPPSDLPTAYSFIPSGFISTTTPQKKRTKEQQQLYEYGNEAGSYVQSFEEAHRDQAQVLKNWLEDRNDPAKSAAVVQLGRALWETGRSLSRIEAVPSAATTPHKALAGSFMEIGANLALVPKTGNDGELLKAIEVYNASADAYAKNFIAAAGLFAAYGVGFTADDPGSVFTFTPIGL